MRSVLPPAHTGTLTPPSEQPSELTPHGGDGEQWSAERLEAVILRLDGPTAERLFRLAAE